MRMVNMNEAKSHLSNLLAAVDAGEVVIIARAGRPVARLSRYAPEERPIGIDDGRLTIADDFDSWLPEGFEPYLTPSPR